MPITTQSIASYLSQCSAYPEAPRVVKTIETHISWVFLTEHFAYKLKKPVAFDFLDFRTPELRRIACEDEVRLNRRLAEDVYLGVVPVTMDPQGHFELGGLGQAIDFVVQMKRLPAERSLDRLLAAGLVAQSDLERLAQRLATFYRQLPPLELNAEEYRRQIESHVRANRHSLLQFSGDLAPAQVETVHGTQLQYLALAPDQFDRRVRGGRIVEGHGDLRPEHVYLFPEPVVLDCIEFNSEFRQIDVLDELGFLAMECDRLRAGPLGEAVLRRCTVLLDDEYPLDLLSFYKSYRACVRAKVAALRGWQHGGDIRRAALDEARAYLDLAGREAIPLRRPMVVLVRGLSGTGKSTIASRVADTLGAKWLSTDLLRTQVLGKSAGAAVPDKYQAQQRAAVYGEMFRQGGQYLGEGRTVILDGTFLKTDLVHQAAALAAQYQAPLLLVECDCAAELAQQRIARRLAQGNSASEAFPELHAQQRGELEPSPHGLAGLRIDTSENADLLLAQILKSLSLSGSP